MTTFAISMVKDEADIVGVTVGRMLAQVEHVIVADNGSTDGSRDILHELAQTGRLTILDDPDPAYYQSVKMSALAQRAAAEGADWVIPFDADEVWQSTNGMRITEVLDLLPRKVLVATAMLHDRLATAKDPVGDPVARMRWRRPEALGLPKVACRALPGLTIHQGNHAATFADVASPRVADGLLRVAHFPYRSADQFVRKARNGAAAYAATTLPQDTGAHWRQYGALIDEHGEQAARDWFHEHFYSQDPGADGLIFDPVA